MIKSPIKFTQPAMKSKNHNSPYSDNFEQESDMKNGDFPKTPIVFGVQVLKEPISPRALRLSCEITYSNVFGHHLFSGKCIFQKLQWRKKTLSFFWLKVLNPKFSHQVPPCRRFSALISIWNYEDLTDMGKYIRRICVPAENLQNKYLNWQKTQHTWDVLMVLLPRLVNKEMVMIVSGWKSIVCQNFNLYCNKPIWHPSDKILFGKMATVDKVPTSYIEQTEAMHVW